MKTLKYLLMAGCVLGLEIGSALGQGDSFSCTQCVCVYDNTCSQVTPCADTPSTDCRNTVFTAACSGDYYLKAILDCGPQPQLCKNCFPCVKLRDYNTGGVVQVCHTDCEAYDCERTCRVTLASGTQYILEVCLRGCAENSCDDCACTARGYVYKSWSDCSTIPPCN